MRIKKKILKYYLGHPLYYAGLIMAEEEGICFPPHGYGSGLVGVSADHPWYGEACEVIDEQIGYIHGGLTFSGYLGDKADIWWVGFDTCHHGDTQTSWPREMVEDELNRLYNYAREAGE